MCKMLGGRTGPSLTPCVFTYAGHALLYSTLLIGHIQQPGYMRLSSWPFVARKLPVPNRQDMVFVRPPGISDGAFQLRMGNSAQDG